MNPYYVIYLLFICVELSVTICCNLRLKLIVCNCCLDLCLVVESIFLLVLLIAFLL